MTTNRHLTCCVCSATTDYLRARIAALESQLRDQAMQRVSDFCQEQEAAARQPLTDEQIYDGACDSAEEEMCSYIGHWFEAGVRFAEEHHNITGDSHE